MLINFLRLKRDTILLGYLAPELRKILDEKKLSGNYDPLATDIFSLGIIILELLLPKKLIF